MPTTTPQGGNRKSEGHERGAASQRGEWPTEPKTGKKISRRNSRGAGRGVMSWTATLPTTHESPKVISLYPEKQKGRRGLHTLLWTIAAVNGQPKDNRGTTVLKNLDGTNRLSITVQQPVPKKKGRANAKMRPSHLALKRQNSTADPGHEI